jgi:hypothetical protein
MLKPKYPVSCFVRTKVLESGQTVPAKAPLEKSDPMEAYAPFVYGSLEEAQRAIAQHMMEQWQAVLDGDLRFDEVDHSDSVCGCDLYEDGAISFEDFEMERSEVFAAWGAPDPEAVPAPVV